MDMWVKAFAQIGALLVFLIVTAGLGLLFAWPLKWTWNYVMPYLFDFKTLSWGQAWCLSWVMGILIKGNHYGGK
jgi:hypothetical protein